MIKLRITDEIFDAPSKELPSYIKEHENALRTVQTCELCYKDSIGWLDTSVWAGEEVISKIEKLAEEIRKKAEAFVLIGVGGSNNAARSVIEAIAPDGKPEIIYAGNTISANAINKVIERLKGKEVYINCIAKNFETLEPGVSFRILRQFLVQKYGKEEAAKHIICTGTIGSSLDKLCSDNGYAFVPFPDDIGGRYTALSYVGLLPMAVAGIDIRALVDGGLEMELNLRSSSPKDNLAMQYASLRNIYFSKGYKLELLSAFEPQLCWFYKWWEQLFAESEGKDGTGLFPVTGEFSEELHSLGQYIQDGSPIMFETFLDIRDKQDSLIIRADDIPDGFDYLNGRDLWDVNKASFEATRLAHSKKLPCITLEIVRLDAYHFGQLFYFFQFACYLSGKLLGINPFDQPGVEAYKERMFKALGKPVKSEN